MGKISQEEIEELIKLPGQARGVTLETDLNYIKDKKGPEGAVAWEQELKKMGFPFSLGSIKAIDWYPLGLRALSLLAAKKVFNWQDKEIEDMGNAAPKYSFIVKLLLRYFVTFSKTYEESPTYWKKHYTVGELEANDYSYEKKYAVLKIKDFDIHPIMCSYLKGYFMRMCQLAIKGSKNFKAEETKCIFSGDKYHEILLKWEL
jgi:hypothetical protein